MNMNKKYIAILAALLPVFAACNPSEGGKTILPKAARTTTAEAVPSLNLPWR